MGRLAELIGREKLKAGRGSWLLVERCDDCEGDRGIDALVIGEKGEWDLDMLELGDRVRF